MPTNPQCTFSPTALRHYLHYKIITEHLTLLTITTSSGIKLQFPPIKSDTDHQLLNYHQFHIVKPKVSTCHLMLPSLIANSATSEAPLTRLLVHQRLGHNSDEVLDSMCPNQSLLGLPKHPFPPQQCPCVICITTKTVNPPKAKSTSTKFLRRGQLLHIDFSFWNVCSIRGFTCLLSVIDGKDRMLWNFPTTSKRVPLSILAYLFTMLEREGVIIESVRADEDGALANNSEFSDFLIQQKISLQTTGGYTSFLNGKVDQHHCTIAQMVHSLLLNSGLPSNSWCYAAEATADIYRYTLHSTLGTTPYEAWYGIKPSIDNLCVWGCYVYVRLPHPKKLDHRVTRGLFLGFTKSRLIVCWYDPVTKTVKHASAIHFDEHNTHLHESDTLSPGALILSGTTPTLPNPSLSVDISDHPFLSTKPFMVSVHLPATGQGLGYYISHEDYHNLPCISSFVSGTHLSPQLLQHGQSNSSFWILSVNSQEFITAHAIITYLKSLQDPKATLYIPVIFARRIASQRTSLAGNRVVFNQIRLSTDKSITDESDATSIIALVGLKVVSSPTHPDTPPHFGAIFTSPFASDWRDALFHNYNKMMTSGTFSALILCSSVPSNKTILRLRVTCKVKDTSIPNQHDLYARSCANGSTQCENIDFTDSYSPVASIDSL